MVLNPQAREKVWLPIRNVSCTLCPLHEEAKTVCLLGDGPVPNKLMIIGEAPGAREDDIERPFSGVAGKYLDRILQEVGIPRESIYISNAVHCRPPNNRTPTKTEIKTCSVYLKRELEIVNPEHILLLGNTALESITGKTGILKKRGTANEIDGRFYYPALHPAAILRNPAHEGAFKADLLHFGRAAHGQDIRPETKTGLIRNSKGLALLCQMLTSVETPMAFDVETGSSDPNERDGGLHPWSPNGIIHTAAFCWEPGKAYVVGLEHPEVQWDIPIERVYQALGVALSGKKMVGHNIKFDLQWMRAKGVELYGHFDTKLARHLLDENGPGGLKPLSRTYLGAEEYEANISFGSTVGRLIPLAIYNGKDADYTLRLYHIFREELKKQPRLLRLFLKLMMPACRTFTEIETVGFPVDMERLKIRDKEIKVKISEIEEQLISFIPEERKKLANFRSPVFLGWFFFDYLKLPIIFTTPTGKPSTAESTLLQLRKKHQAVDLLMELRKWQKYESTYTRNWLDRVSIVRKPRLHTSYNLSGTVTGRLSSDMQQVPREVYIRSIIGSRPGWCFIEADFSQIELRIAAMFSRDPALTKAFTSGGDPHRETAAKILNKDPELITKEERKMAKAVNFGFLYGMGANKFKVYAEEKYQTIVSIQEARDYRKAFFDQYKGLLAWHERQRRLVRNLQFVQSPIGRIRHLQTILSTDEEIQAQAEREAINAPVQGFASDLTVLSMIIAYEKLRGKPARIIGNVHDSIIAEAREDFAEEAAKIIKDTMENLPLQQLFGYKTTIPIEAEIFIGQHWGEK